MRRIRSVRGLKKETMLIGEMICGAYGDEFRTNQLANKKEIAVTRNTQKKGYGVADVPNNELDGERRIIDVEVSAPPRQETVYKA